MSLYAKFATIYEQIFPFREPVYDFLIKDLPPLGRVLDIGCGPGHYAGRFAGDGYSATGIDLDSAMIATGRSNYGAASFQVLGMEDISSLTGPFALIYSIGNVVAHVDQVAFAKVAEQVQKLLATGGRWVFQTVNWDHILAQGDYRFPLRSLADEGITFVREYRDISNRQVTFSTALRGNSGELFRESLALFPTTCAYCREVHRDLGMVELGCYADFGGTPFVEDVDSGRVFVFTKPGVQG